MKNLFTTALSLSSRNAFNNTGRMLTQAGTTALVAGVAGTAVAAMKTGEITAAVAVKCEAASRSLAQWLQKRVPVEGPKQETSKQISNLA